MPMSSERHDSNGTDAEQDIAQYEQVPQLHRDSFHTQSPTAMQQELPVQSPPQQVGPPYGLQSVQQNVTDSTGSSTTLAVTNLPYRIRWQDLKDLFRRYGTPSRADVFLAPDGRSRGVGMVSMRTRREAENCVNDLNGYEWFGRKIGVRIDETGGHHALAAAAMAGATIWEGIGYPQDYETLPPQMQTYPAAVNTTAANPYLTQTTSPALFVGNLPFSTQWQDLKDLLRPAGRILRADIALAPDGRSKGWGTAVFATLQEAQNAIDTFDGWEVDGRIIKVRWDKYQGSAPSQPSPQLAPAAALSSPQLMHTQLSPTQTPRPADYVAIPPNQPQPPPPNWQAQYLPGNIRSVPPSTIQTPQPITMAAPQSQFPQAYQFQSPSPAQPAAPPGTFHGVMYSPSGGWYPGYGTPVPPMTAPQVRLPSSATEMFNALPQQANHPPGSQRTDSSFA